MITKEDKIVIKQFSDKSSNFFVDFVHYSLNADNTISFCSGGIDTEERREALKKYIKNNKKQFLAREKSAEINYTETINFGEHKGKFVYQCEKKLLNWMLEKYTFKPTEAKLKEEIIQFLK